MEFGGRWQAAARATTLAYCPGRYVKAYCPGLKAYCPGLEFKDNWPKPREVVGEGEAVCCGTVGDGALVGVLH